MPKLGNLNLVAASLLLLALTMPIAVGATKAAAMKPTQYTASIGVIDLSVNTGGGAGAVSYPILAVGGVGAIVPSVAPGTTLLVRFTAVYLAGARGGVTNNTVVLDPQTASFGFSTPSSSLGSYFKTLVNQSLTPTSSVGTYTSSFQVTPDFPAGGTVILWVLTDSLHDAQHNWGPPIDTSTDLTRLEIGTPESWLAQYGVPLLIGVLVLLALILLLARSRKRKKK